MGSLAALREQIDAIDAELLTLVDRRAGLAREIAAAKAEEAQASGVSGPQTLIRPDREALLLRRLIHTPKLAASDAVVVRIWRELIGESLRLQGAGLGLVTAVAETNSDLKLWLRERFGVAPVMVTASAPNDVIAVAREANRIGAISLDAKLGAWWGRLLLEKDVRVIAALPEGPDGAPQALAFAAVRPEPTGDDETYFVTDFAGSVSALSQALSERGLAGERIGYAQGLSLVSLSGFVQEDDARLSGAFGSLSGVIGAAPRL